MKKTPDHNKRVTTRRVNLPALALISGIALNGCATIGSPRDTTLSKPRIPDHSAGASVDRQPVNTDQQQSAIHKPAEPSIAAALSAINPLAQDQNHFSRSIYLASGVGASWLEPDTREAPFFSVNDRMNPAGQIAIGADLNKWLSLELHSADLGSAGLSPAGRINYHMNGISALIYAGGDRKNFRRQGITSYARVGYGQLKNSPVGDVPFTQKNATQILFGAGLEYVFGNGIGLRGEIISFDSDAQYAQLALNYRLARADKRRVKLAESAPPVVIKPTVELAPPVPAPVATPPVIAAATAPTDADNDGVFDQNDTCPQTPAGASVGNNGCVIFDRVTEIVKFHSDSGQLTDVARNKLDEVAQTLSRYSQSTISIDAHTDSRGDDTYNQRLSEHRAKSVLHYLKQRGIPVERMTASAHGESQPIASNDTEHGRLRNRRVELYSQRFRKQRVQK